MLAGYIEGEPQFSWSNPVRIPILILDYMAKFTPILLVCFITRITAFLACDVDSAETPDGIENQESSSQDYSVHFNEGFASLKGSIRESERHEVNNADLTQDDSCQLKTVNLVVQPTQEMWQNNNHIQSIFTESQLADQSISKANQVCDDLLP